MDTKENPNLSSEYTHNSSKDGATKDGATNNANTQDINSDATQIPSAGFLFRVKIKLAAFGMVLVLLALFALVTIVFLNAPPSNQASVHTIEILNGEPLAQIAAKFDRHNIIRSALFFRIVARMHDYDHLVQSGTFAIPTHLTSYQVLEFITQGNQLLEKITIPEGLTIRKIGALLESRQIVAAQEFYDAASDPTLLQKYAIPANTAEGFLYPDTYFFPKKYSAKQVVATMIEHFYQVLSDNWPEYQDMAAEEFYTTIIIASLIEREYVDPEEADLIASVFYNRMDIGMALQSCATVVYVITEELLLPHPQQLLYSDLDYPSRYNTYYHNELPPTPIANPGAIALRAAFTPADTNYIYFVLKGPDSTRHHFSHTIEEHSEATIFYLRGN